MNIKENKRVTAVAAVMGLAFVGLCYYGYDRYSALQSTQARINEINRQVEAYSDEDIVPTAKNSEAISQAAKEAKEYGAKLTAEMSQYAAFCLAGKSDVYKPITSPIAFQSKLKELVGAMAAYANGKCTFGAEDRPGDDASGVSKFGLGQFELQPPREADVPYYGFLLHAINGTMKHIIDAGSPSIKKVYCRPLPEEADRKAKYIRLGYEVAFTAKRSEVINPENPESFSVLPQVINKLAHDKDVYYIVTGLVVKDPNDNSQPEANVERLNPTVAPAAGEGAEPEEGAEATEDNAKVAEPLVGNPDDTVDVFMNIQVLYFTTDKL